MCLLPGCVCACVGWILWYFVKLFLNELLAQPLLLSPVKGKSVKTLSATVKFTQKTVKGKDICGHLPIFQATKYYIEITSKGYIINWKRVPRFERHSFPRDQQFWSNKKRRTAPSLAIYMFAHIPPPSTNTSNLPSKTQQEFSKTCPKQGY